MSSPLVSVIISTYNEESNIERCLRSIKNQTYKNKEIIVVDSVRTSDSTSEIAGKYTSQVYRYGNERSQQRNYGAKKAKGKYLLVLDADMKLAKKVVADCVEKAFKNNLDAVIIPEKSVGESYWAKCKALERNCYIGDETIEAPRFFRKSMFRRVGGFDEKMISGEDWDLRNRILKQKGKMGRVENLIFHNEGKTSLRKIVSKKLYYSQKAGNYLEANLKDPVQVLLFIFRPAYFKNGRLLLSDPVHFPGFIFMKFSEFVVGGFGAIIFNKIFWKKLFKSF